MAGMIGATRTVTGMPASESLRMVSRRLAGLAARGSMARWSLVSRVVTETALGELPVGHLSEDVDVARDEGRFRDDADRMVRTVEHFQDRTGDLEAPFDRLVGIGIGPERDGPRLVARAELPSRSSAAFALAKILVSKSRPAERPWYAWVGRAKQ